MQGDGHTKISSDCLSLFDRRIYGRHLARRSRSGRYGSKGQSYGLVFTGVRHEDSSTEQMQPRQNDSGALSLIRDVRHDRSIQPCSPRPNGSQTERTEARHHQAQAWSDRLTVPLAVKADNRRDRIHSAYSTQGLTIQVRARWIELQVPGPASRRSVVIAKRIAVLQSCLCENSGGPWGKTMTLACSPQSHVGPRLLHIESGCYIQLSKHACGVRDALPCPWRRRRHTSAALITAKQQGERLNARIGHSSTGHSHTSPGRIRVGPFRDVMSSNPKRAAMSTVSWLL